MKTNPKIIYQAIAAVAVILSSFSVSDAQDDFRKWIKTEMEEYQEFKDKRDKEFIGFLKKEWKEFQLSKGLVMDETPKPAIIPVADKKPEDKPTGTVSGKKVVIKDIPTLPEPIPEPVLEKEPVAPSPAPVLTPEPDPEKEPVTPFFPPDLTPEPDFEEEPVTSPQPKGKILKFAFFDSPLSISIDENFQAVLGDEINKETISGFWATLSKADYEGLLLQSDSYKRQMELNDWGYLLLLQTIGEAVYREKRNEINLFVWFLLSKSGYETRIGYSKERIYLLLPSKQTFFSVPYFTLKDKRFYMALAGNDTKDSESLYTYDGNYPDANKLIDLKIYEAPNIINKITDKKFSFKYGDKEYTVIAKYNKNTVEFFKYYPQTNIEVYFGASVSRVTSSSLLNALKPIIEGKTETEAVNILLRFVQTAFSYKTDGDQFGREKYLFSEETLFYEYSDCEDRSILFAFLVKRLTGLDVIGLDFPGHIATAVKFSDKIDGDSIRYKGETYIICDPTYINASIGMRMPNLKGVTPEIIRIDI